jgi:hypothetical protein
MSRPVGQVFGLLVVLLLSFVHWPAVVRDHNAPLLAGAQLLSVALVLLGCARHIRSSTEREHAPAAHEVTELTSALLALACWWVHLFGTRASARTCLAVAVIVQPLLMALDVRALTHTAPDRAWQANAKLALFNIALFALLVAGAETGFRRLSRMPWPMGADFGMRYDFVLSPYLMFAEPDAEHGGTLNRQGFDGPELSAAANPGEYRVAVLGGSAAWRGGRTLSIAHFLEQELEARLSQSGRSARVVNFGRQSYVSMQELILRSGTSLRCPSTSSSCTTASTTSGPRGNSNRASAVPTCIPPSRAAPGRAWFPP